MYTLPKLKYTYDALEPYIDARTMEIHHTKHHQTYIDNLNKAFEKYPELFNKILDQLIMKLEDVPEDIRLVVNNNGGGHLNHTFFWDILTPNSAKIPTKSFEAELNKYFTNFDSFKEQFTKAALSRFGSGWAWLVVDTDNQLKVITTANQDSPLKEMMKPVLGVDVWEHAYYLKYQNRRAEYLENFWNIVNWNQVEAHYKIALEY